MPLGQTEEKLRSIGCTMDQRKRLMMAAKFGLGPMKQLGLAPPLPGEEKRSDDRSRSPSHTAPPPPAGPPLMLPAPAAAASASSSAAPSTVQTVQVLRQPNVGRRAAVSKMVKKKEEDDEDVDSFLAGGRAMAVAAAKAQKDAKEQAVRVEAAAAGVAERVRTRHADEKEAGRERERAEEDRRRKELERKRQEEERERQEEERKREERRKVRQEEKRRRKEERARQREQARREAGDDELEEDDAGAGSSSDEDRSRQRRKPASGGVFKQAFRADDNKRLHWGESVKGRVSNDYKGFSDADLDRRFGLQQQNASGEKLMTEEEVLAMLKRGRGSSKD